MSEKRGWEQCTLIKQESIPTISFILVPTWSPTKDTSSGKGTTWYVSRKATCVAERDTITWWGMHFVTSPASLWQQSPLLHGQRNAYHHSRTNQNPTLSKPHAPHSHLKNNILARNQVGLTTIFTPNKKDDLKITKRSATVSTTLIVLHDNCRAFTYQDQFREYTERYLAYLTSSSTQTILSYIR